MAGTKRFDEQVVLNIALEVFERFGYRETTMVELSEATGLQCGALYQAYGDKEELYLRAFDNLVRTFYEQVGRALQKPDKRAALQSFLELVVPLNYTARCGIGTTIQLVTELGGSSDRLRGSLAEFFRTLEELLCEALSADGESRQLSMSPGDAAKLIIATTRGIAVMRNVYPGPAPLMTVVEALLSAVVPYTAHE